MEDTWLLAPTELEFALRSGIDRVENWLFIPVGIRVAPGCSALLWTTKLGSADRSDWRGAYHPRPEIESTSQTDNVAIINLATGSVVLKIVWAEFKHENWQNHAALNVVVVVERSFSPFLIRSLGIIQGRIIWSKIDKRFNTFFRKQHIWKKLSSSLNR